ncbi:MAG: hypothetical protein PVI57_00575 [Gemmatimonadota bacterium]|jgi:hypothetical protein
MNRTVSAALLALFLLACGEDPTGGRGPAAFELELRNHIVQEGQESRFTPELIVVAADPEARLQSQDVVGITVIWPDGTASIVSPGFSEEDGRLQASSLDENDPGPLPDGVYEVTIRFDDGEAEVLETNEEITPLSPAPEVVISTFADEVEVRWTAPPETHDWRMEVYRVIDRPGPQEFEKILDVPGGTVADGGPQVARFSIEQLEPGEGYRAVLILSNDQNVRVIDGGGQRPSA